MATLTNSQRRTYKATYTPLGGLQVASVDDSGSAPSRALDKSGYIGTRVR
jgi:hypothetical protein